MTTKIKVPECIYCDNEAWDKCANCGNHVCNNHIDRKGYSWYHDIKYNICKGCKHIDG